LRDALELLDLKLIDHIIIAGNRHSSMSASGILASWKKRR
jgi:DNA repair protein RadC